MLWLQVVVNGVLMGVFFALVASGLSLVWGISNILNLAHGALIVLGAYLAFWLFQLFGLDPILSIPLVMVLMFGFGWLLYYAFLWWPLQRGATPFTVLLLTFGVDLLLANSMRVAWSADFRTVVTTYNSASLNLGGIHVQTVMLIAAGLGIVLNGALALFLGRTKVGAALEATGLDDEAAELTGINTGRYKALSFALGSTLAGAAGSVLAITSAVNPFFGDVYAFRAALIAVLAGLGSVPALLVAGVLVGLAETFGTVLISPAYANAVSLLLLVVVLIVRPSGLMGRKFFAEL